MKNSRKRGNGEGLCLVKKEGRLWISDFFNFLWWGAYRERIKTARDLSRWGAALFAFGFQNVSIVQKMCNCALFIIVIQIFVNFFIKFITLTEKKHKILKKN